MNARELRIGNLVYPDSTGDIVEITADDFQDTSFLEPIQLTEEWLVKFGFEKIDHIGGYSFWSTKRKKNSRHSGITIYSSYTTIGNNSMVKHCEHVHQLQNLYFALTGEEVKFKDVKK